MDVLHRERVFVINPRPRDVLAVQLWDELFVNSCAEGHSLKHRGLCLTRHLEIPQVLALLPKLSAGCAQPSGVEGNAPSIRVKGTWCFLAS